MNTCIKQFLIVLGIFYGFSASCQYAVGNLDLDGDIAEWYDKTNGIKDFELFEGSYFKVANLSLISHQFFGDDHWSMASIVFDGQTFDNVQMLYDIYEDLVILRNTNYKDPSHETLRINQNKIESFTFQESLFRNLKTSDTSSASPGIYHVLFEGEKTGMVVKRAKSTKTVDTGFDRTTLFYSRDKYYLAYNDIYVSYNNKGTFYTTFSEFKPQLKSYIKKNGLKLKKGNDPDLITLMAYCEKLVTN